MNISIDFRVIVFSTSGILMKNFFLLFLLQQRVNKSKLSGDFDTAEGGFDILMQLAACDEVILIFFYI